MVLKVDIEFILGVGDAVHADEDFCGQGSISDRGCKNDAVNVIIAPGRIFKASGMRPSVIGGNIEVSITQVRFQINDDLRRKLNVELRALQVIVLVLSHIERVEFRLGQSNITDLL